MNTMSLFPASVALASAPKAKSPRRSKKTHQQAYLDFLSRVLDRPVREILAEVTTKTRIKKQTSNF